MRKLRVLYIQVPSGGGSLFAMYEMLRCIDRNYVEPIIICNEKNKHTLILETLKCTIFFLSDSNLKENDNQDIAKSIKIPLFPNSIRKVVSNIYKYYISDKKTLKQIEGIFLDQKIDIIHHNNDISLNRNFVRVANKYRMIQILHNRSLKKYSNDFFYHFIDKILIKKINYHIHISEAVKNHFTKIFKLPLKKCAVIRDIVDESKFKTKDDTEYLYKEFNVEKNTFIISNIGRIIAWKGQDIFIEALKKVIIKKPNVKAFLVGSFEKGIGSKIFYNEIIKKIIDYGLEKNIVITGDREDVCEIINFSNIIIHSATKPEPQGLVIIEALFCKKPVIVANAGGAGELATLYGVATTQPGKPDELAEMIISVLENQDKYIKNQNKYFDKLKNDFNWKSQIKDLLAIYNKII